MIKLIVGWGLRARRYKKRISVGSAENIARECMTEKNKTHIPLKHIHNKDGRIDTERKGKDILIDWGKRKKRRGMK